MALGPNGRRHLVRPSVAPGESDMRRIQFNRNEPRRDSQLGVGKLSSFQDRRQTAHCPETGFEEISPPLSPSVYRYLARNATTRCKSLRWPRCCGSGGPIALRGSEHTGMRTRANRDSVQRQSNSKGWLHRMITRRRHQLRHLCDLTCLVAKQVLSQLSYTPACNGLIVTDFPCAYARSNCGIF